MRKEFERYTESRNLVISDLAEKLEELMSPLVSKPTIKARHKDFESYFKKYIRLLGSEESNAKQPVITDLIGIRIVCPFIEDIYAIENIIKEKFDVAEVERKGSQYSFKEFGYESLHLLIKIPENIIEKRGKCDCDIAEIQIRTILQDAWAEVEHELVYKADFTPYGAIMKRKLAALNANLSLADTIFQEIRAHQHKLNGQLGQRRGSFSKKIE
jgi:putative GTP pyrophosphokinase